MVNRVGPLAGGENGVGQARERLCVRVGQGCPGTIQAIGEVDGLNPLAHGGVPMGVCNSDVLVDAGDLVRVGGLEDVAGDSHHGRRPVGGEVGDQRVRAPDVPVQGRVEVVALEIITDDPVVETWRNTRLIRPQPRRQGPRFRVTDVVRGGVARSVGDAPRLVDQLVNEIPPVLRRKEEDLRRPMVVDVIARVVELDQVPVLGLSLTPIGERHVPDADTAGFAALDLQNAGE